MIETTNREREKVLAKIRALLAKTEEAGATEHEALAAAEKARKLLEQYQIDLGQEELRREGFVQKNIELDAASFAFVRRIMAAVDAPFARCGPGTKHSATRRPRSRFSGSRRMPS